MWAYEPKWDGFRALCYAGDETVRITSRQQGVARELLLVKGSSRLGRSLAYAGSRQEGADVNEAGGSSVPQPTPQAAPGGFAAAEPLPDLIRRIVREELRPIHLLVAEIRERSR